MAKRLDFGQIASGRVASDSSGRVLFVKPARRAAGEIVGLRPETPSVAEVKTSDGEYVLIVVGR